MPTMVRSLRPALFLLFTGLVAPSFLGLASIDPPGNRVSATVLESIGPRSGAREVSVGDELIDGRYLEPFEVRWVARNISGDGSDVTVTYRVKEVVERLHDGDRDVIRFTQYWNDSDDVNLFTTVRTADARTLGYVAFHTGGSPNGFSHLDFEGRYVTGFYAPDAHLPARAIAAYVDEPVFASFGGLLYAIVLKGFDEGISIPGFSYGGENPIFRTEQLGFQGTEIVELPGGEERRCRVVTSSRSPGHKFWVDSTRVPYFLKVAVPGTDGASTVFEIEHYALREAEDG